MIFTSIAILAAALSLPINTEVTQENIKSTICTRGWTKTVRPAVEWTDALKLEMLGGDRSKMKCCELDHIIPLELGGAPADKRNLQLQVWPEARQKDEVENCLNKEVCAGRLSLDEARQSIWKDWRAAKAHCTVGNEEKK